MSNWKRVVRKVGKFFWKPVLANSFQHVEIDYIESVETVAPVQSFFFKFVIDFNLCQNI